MKQARQALPVVGPELFLAAEWLVKEGFPFDTVFVDAPPARLREAVVAVYYLDRDGKHHGNTLSLLETRQWLNHELETLGVGWRF